MRAAPVAVAPALMAGPPACGGDDGDGVSGAESAPSAYGALVAWTNDVAEILNATEVSCAFVIRSQ